MTYYDQVIEAAAFLMTGLRSLKPRIGPQIGIVLGSGLGAVANAVTDPILIPYAEIPHFPQSTVEGHSGSRSSSCRAAFIITRATRRIK
jgi:purine-nucleoside phosphorylase